MKTEHTLEQAFRLGWEEADGWASGQDTAPLWSEAYDCGRTVGRLPEPWKSALAAAPAMLAALKACADYLGEMGHPEDILAQARAAIAQAEGDTP